MECSQSLFAKTSCTEHCTACSMLVVITAIHVYTASWAAALGP